MLQGELNNHLEEISNRLIHYTAHVIVIMARKSIYNLNLKLHYILQYTMGLWPNAHPLLVPTEFLDVLCTNIHYKTISFKY
jgi:hypothetical protein